jgi:ectoine hydroxylase-related dioxygenase (phytanoyl-CoA dioxygenase family)
MNNRRMRFDEMDEIKKDIAGTHEALARRAETEEERRSADDAMTQVREQGFVIFERLLDEETLAALKADLLPRFDRFGRNEGLEGRRTQRIYSLLAKTRSCDRLVDHPRILALLDRVLQPSYLLSQLQPIYIHPGERAQILHHDDAFYPMKRPRPAYSAATIFAIDDFTADNGATVVIPGSHLWDDRRPGAGDAPLTVVMPAGSVIFFLGTLWHGGGANRSERPRLAVSAQYCEPWARQQENMGLSIPREVVKTLSSELRSMVGYSIHPPFMGMVDGESPLKLLEG